MSQVHKALRSFFYIAVLFGGPSLAFAGVSITSISVSNSAPSPGSVIGVTIVYCESANTTPFWLVALNPSSTTIQACPNSNQALLVDGCTGSTGTSPVSSSRDDASDTCGGNGWAGIAVPNSPPPCPYTQIFNITIPNNASPGPNNLIVVAGDYYVQCNNGIVQQVHTTLNIPLPPAAFTIAKRAEATTAAPNGLILFDIDYSFVNTNNFIITDPLPANTSFVTAGPGGGLSGGSVTWNLGNATIQLSGTAWALVSVNSGTADNTIIANQASGSTNEVLSQNTNSVAVTVQIPQLSLLKSQSAPSLSGGSTVTYNLDWTANGQNLQLYDSYDNISVGGNTTGASVPWGYDLTNYTVFPQGDSGNWVVQTDSSGNHYISASTQQTCGGGSGHYPELIRNVPGYDICGDVIVEGDLQIPMTTSAGPTCTGADAHMVIACNPSQGITLKAGISMDALPGRLFAQYNNDYQGGYWPSMQDNSLPFSINQGSWYTMRTQIAFSSAASAVSFYVQLWPRDNPANVASVTFYDSPSIDPLVVLPTCSGGWRAGWQADETAGTDFYSNLKVFGPGPILSAAVTDIVPAGVTYIGSSTGGTYSAGTISWGAPAAFPTTMYSFDTPVNWWGTVACPGPIYNDFTMAANSVPPVTSNTVTLTVTGGCITNTPTSTPTITPTNTPSPTATQTPSPTPTTCGVGSWTTRAPMPGIQDRFAIGVVSGLLYVVGGENSAFHNGLNTMEYYNPTSNSWTAVAPLPTGRNSLAVAVWNGILYAVGGINSAGTVLNTVEAYNPITNSWTTEASMPTARDDFSLEAVNGILYAIGGDDGTTSLNTVEAYNTATNSWSTVASMPTARDALMTSVVNGVVYAIGGKTGALYNYSGVMNTVEAYDPTTNSWTTVAPMSGIRAYGTAEAINGIIYVVGGTDGVSYFNSQVAYDPTGNSWSNQTSMPTARDGFAAGVVNGTLYEVGGFNSGFLAVNEAETISCLTPIPTNTPTPSFTSTPTPSFTPTNTTTPVNTPTFTPTPVGLHVWPNPFDPKYAVGGVLKAYQVPAGAEMRIYTVSGELVIKLQPDGTGLITWGGRNSNGSKVSSGVYYYLIKSGSTTLLSGKLLVITDQ